jgi:MSHA biogenesis protein MshQ
MRQQEVKNMRFVHFCLSLSLLICSPGAWANNFSSTYTYSLTNITPTFEWPSATATTITSWDGTCANWSNDDDNKTVSFPSGFTFTFAGVNYSSVRVMTDSDLRTLNNNEKITLMKAVGAGYIECIVPTLMEL